jgi:hypothetical protein
MIGRPGSFCGVWHKEDQVSISLDLGSGEGIDDHRSGKAIFCAINPRPETRLISSLIYTF